MIEVKYDEKQGAKICEIQPVCHSSFSGCDYVYGQKGVIGKSICHHLSQFGNSIWFMDPIVSHLPVREQFLTHNWKPFRSILEPKFHLEELWQKALTPPFDPTNISDYSAIVYAKIRDTDDLNNLYSKFPGAILIDRANVPYMHDKHAQSLLFSGNPTLEKAKPKWASFLKNYHADLVSDITSKIDSDILVIKPLKANQGRGVIIVNKKDLDETLKLILNPDLNLIEHPDRGYNYWKSDLSSSFIVEEFIVTEPILVQGAENRPFDLTFRLVVAMIYQQETLHLHFLGSYVNLPDKPLDEEGGLNEKHKTSLVISRSIKTPRPIEKKIYHELTKPLLVLYKRILGFKLAELEDGIESSIVTECNLEDLILSQKMHQ